MIEDKFADEMLTDEELDMVAGGNDLECFEIGDYIYTSRLRKEYKGYYSDMEYMKSFLLEKLGIDAELNNNKLDSNKYTDVATGKSMTQNEVKDKIVKSYGYNPFPNG